VGILNTFDFVNIVDRSLNVKIVFVTDGALMLVFGMHSALACRFAANAC
jgi:hypothetical protein